MTACNDCQQSAPSAEHRKVLKPIGETVTSEIRLKRGHDQTDYYFLQCPTCGSVWMNYRDSGAGGHGDFWDRLTKKYF
jgi:hypothetical protein